MSHVGNSAFGGNPNNATGDGQNPNNRGASFDSSGANVPNRDPWNNRIEKEKPPKEPDPNDPNNTSIDDDVIDNIWNKVENRDSNTNTNNNNNNNNNNTNTNTNTNIDPNARMEEYLNSVGLGKFELSEQEKTSMQNGDFEGVLSKMNQRITDAHLKALSGSQKLIKEAVDQALAQARTEGTAAQTGRENLRALNDALPFTKKPAISPIAQTVMQRFLNRGWSTEKAIKGVEAYFQNISEEVSGQSINKNRNSNFSSGNSEKEKENNWLAILSPSGQR